MTGNQREDRIHRIVRGNYAPRSLSFLATFVIILLLTPEQGHGTATLLMAVFSFLVYPHLVYLRARAARDSKAAELDNLLIDSALLGTWSAVTAFNLWLTFALLLTTLTNSAIQGGPRRLALAIGCYLVGALSWVLINGLAFQPYANLWVTVFTATIMLVYLLAVALKTYQVNNQLIQAHLAIQNNNQVFRSLLKFSGIAQKADDVQQLCDHSLDLFRRLEPNIPFGLVLFERDRPRQLQNGSFRGLSDQVQNQIIDCLIKHQTSDNRRRALSLDHLCEKMIAIPLDKLREDAAAFVIMGKPLADRLGKLLNIFLDQLAAAIQNKLLTERLRRAAETDGLTGVFNRHYLEKQLKRAIKNKKQYPAADFSVILFDLIGLKRVNDTLGHDAGDQLIIATASGLCSAARETDVVARYGGDEFVVLCPACTEADARQLVKRLIERCEQAIEQSPSGELRSRVMFAISAGVAGSDCHDPDQVLAVADERMYRDKKDWYRRHAVEPR